MKKTYSSVTYRKEEEKFRWKHRKMFALEKWMNQKEMCVWRQCQRNTETGDPARLPVQVAGRWGQIKWKSVRWGKEYFVLGWLEKPRQDKNLFYGQGEFKKPTPFVLFESPFTSVSRVSRGPPRSIVAIWQWQWDIWKMEKWPECCAIKSRVQKECQNKWDMQKRKKMLSSFAVLFI